MYHDRFKQVGFLDIAAHENVGWFCNAYNSTLLRMNMRTGEVELEAFLPSLSVTGKLQYGSIIYVDGDLVITPYNAQEIVIYNIASKHILKIALNQQEKQKRIGTLFISAIVYDKSVYFFPGRYPAIVKLDLQTYEITYFSEWYDEVKNYIKNEKSVVCNARPICINDYCLFPCYQIDWLIKFSFHDGKYDICKLSDECNHILCLQYDGDDLWIAYADKPLILRYSLRTGSKRIYDQLPIDAEIKLGFTFIYPYKDKILAIPLIGDIFLVYDKITGESSKYLDFKIPLMAEAGKEGLAVTGYNFICYKVIHENEILLYSTFENQILQIDLEKQEVRKSEGILRQKEDINQIKDKYFEREEVLYESDVSSLPYYLHHIGDRKKDMISDANNNMGEEIWRYLGK